MKAAVRIFDGQQNALHEPAPADGRTQLSEPLVLTVDNTAPAASIPDLLETSDSGVSNTDDITNVTAPAFRGVAEHNAIIRVFANGVMVGQGYVGSDGTETTEDTTNPEPDQIGSWEVTIEPLKYGQYVIETEVEDLAGNISARSDPLTIVVAPYEPNDALAEATILGSLEEVTLNDVLLHNADDVDLYKYTAPETGKLIINAFSADAVAMQVRDVANNVIATATGDTVTPGLDVQHLVIPVVSEQDYFIEVLFAGDPPVGPYVQHVAIYDLEIESFATPVPYDLELQDTPVGDPLDPNSDTGRSQFDNVTRINTPTIFFRLDDESFVDAQPANTILFREGPLQPTDSGYAIAIFDEGSTPGQPATPPQTPLGFATATADPGVYTFTTPVLEDGSHFLTARVQMIDPADPTQMGYGGRSLSLEIIVDTEAPPVTFGAAASTTDGLHSESDTGVDGLPETFGDRITSDTTPTFFGAAEANAVVRLYLDVNADGTVDSGDVLIGQTVAVPLDGTNQFPDGYWEVTSSVDMNDPATGLAVTFDGLRTILVTAEDPGGEVSDPDALDVFIDTRGPRVTGVYITDDSGFDLFAPKPTDGPTPLVQSLSIDVEDLPERVAAFLYHALAPGVFPGDPATDPGHYSLEGDYSGVIPIQSVSFNPGTLADGSPATGTIVLEFAEPLPDDRFTLTISDALVDPAGNRLDGESNAVEPHDPPQFPSGDGQPGGDFVARFTVDSRAELGVWTAGSVYLDLNGNFRFDPDNPDQANRDVVHALGFTTDAIFAGNFAESPTDTADGFDKLAVYGRTATGSRWLIDTTNDGVPDLNVAAAGVTGMPVAGNFDNSSGENGDEVGLFTGTTWWFDTTHDFRVDTSLTSSLRGYPIVGDYDGDGYDDLATLNSQLDRIEFDLTGGVFRGWDGSIDATIALPFGEFIGVRERPVSADMDGDGIDDVGLWVPDRGAMTPEEAGEWYFLISNDVDAAARSPGTIDTLNHAFTPSPFGHDLFAQFGDEFAIPVIGNFDPPVTAGTEDPNDAPPADPPQDDPAPGDAPADPEPAEGDPVPGSLNLLGTPGDDVLKVEPGATSNVWIATLNGTPHEVEGAFVSITFDGGGGDDVAVLRDDPDGQDTFTASPDEATLAGAAYSIDVTSVRRVRASSSPGNNDLAIIHDAPGSRDTLKASAEKARLVGETFVIRAKGFRDVQAYATPGDGDVAKLRDSALDDTLEAGTDWARVSNDDAQFGFSIGASGFEFVKARSTNEGDTTDIDPESLDWLLARGWL
ncbi:MAG: hypothetical protein HQ582_08130 [Planctomycetes bacterium]|nr:hypothetical protein [Planctomycetota bacterium]